MCIILFSLHSSIVSIRYSRAGPQRSSCHTMSQQSASQNLGFLGAVRWGQWPHPLWLALGISLECPYFQLKGRDSICASLAFVILSKALRPLGFCWEGKGRERFVIVFLIFQVTLSREGGVGWLDYRKGEARNIQQPTVLGCEVKDAEREWCSGSRNCHPYLSAVRAVSVFATSSQRTQVKGTRVPGSQFAVNQQAGAMTFSIHTWESQCPHRRDGCTVIHTSQNSWGFRDHKWETFV